MGLIGGQRESMQGYIEVVSRRSRRQKSAGDFEVSVLGSSIVESQINACE